MLLAETMVAQHIAFGVIAAVVVIGALLVVTTNNVVRAALYLVAVLAGVGASFLLLGAEFVGITQILVYIGAIVVLFLFGIMLTRAKIGTESDLDNNQRGIGAVTALGLLALLGSILYNGFGRAKVEPTGVGRTADVGLSIFQTYVIPFEVISILLLAALVGAIVIARRD
jgi:NADH-quinone oxidoreductase subunit J